jgi:hypothetical protein
LDHRNFADMKTWSLPYTCNPVKMKGCEEIG